MEMFLPYTLFPEALLREELGLVPTIILPFVLLQFYRQDRTIEGSSLSAVTYIPYLPAQPRQVLVETRIFEGKRIKTCPLGMKVLMLLTILLPLLWLSEVLKHDCSSECGTR